MPTSGLICAAAALCVLASSAPAMGATEPARAQGVATSSLTLLDVAAGGRSASAGTLALVGDTVAPDRTASVRITPVTVDGTAYGARTVTPAQGTTSAPSLDTATVAPGLAGLLRVTSPVLTASASTADEGAASRVGAASLGSVGLLGLPLRLGGTVDLRSVVTRTGSTGTKTLAVEDLALPSLADLLAALGLHLPALPTPVLVELLTELDLLNPAVVEADRLLAEAMVAIAAEVDAAQASLDAATADLAARTAELLAAQSDLAAKEAELAGRTAALEPLRAAVTAAQDELAAAELALSKAVADLDAALAAAGLASQAEYEALSPELKEPLAPTIDPLIAAVEAARTAVTTASGALTQATADLAAAQSAVDALTAAATAARSVVATLQHAVDAAQALVDQLAAALRALLVDVQPLIDRLVAEVVAVLDATPLVSLDRLRLVTRAAAVSAVPGGQSAEVVGGELVGLRVLGTDVLSDVLGTSRLDLQGLTGTTLDRVTGKVAELTGVLSSVLSTVPRFPTLAVPAPQVGLLTRSTGTGVSGGFGTAQAAVSGLSVTIPAVRVPTALAVPGASSLPALRGAAQATDLITTAPVRLQVATLADRVRFRPAAAVAPAAGSPPAESPTADRPGSGTGPGTLTSRSTIPRTGGAPAAAVVGVVLMAAAALVRRRREELAP